MRVRIPNIDSEHSVVRVRYVSQNPTENDRGMTFYQCADVKVTKSAEAAPAGLPKPVAPEAPARGGADCCAAKQFTMEGYETHSWRNPTSKKFYFDAAQNMFRVDTNSGTGKSFVCATMFSFYCLFCFKLVGLPGTEQQVQCCGSFAHFLTIALSVAFLQALPPRTVTSR